MKILISAYACDPYGGSEGAVGWSAICRVSLKHDVYVITGERQRANWNRAAIEHKIPDNIHVRFIGRNQSYCQNRLIARLQSWLFYWQFNRLVLKAAEAWHREVGFDLCHQVTIAAWRMPSPLWRMPIPFVWGPIGGAGFISSEFRSMLSHTARCFELARDMSTLVSRRSGAFRNCIRNSAVVLAANEETEVLLKPFRMGRPLARLPVASVSAEKVLQYKRPCLSRRPPGPLILFAGGNMEGRKGVSLAVRALAIVASKGVDFHYTVAGGGPEIESLRLLCQKLHIDDKIVFHPGYQGDDYVRALQRSDVYFLPSFRETLGMTLVESMLAGCYPVVADTSAQGEIVRMAGGSAIPVTTMDELISGLADAVLWCHGHREEINSIAARASQTVAEYFSTANYDRVIEETYRTALEGLAQRSRHMQS